MAIALQSGSGSALRAGLQPFWPAIASIAIFGLICLYGSLVMPGGYDGSLNVNFAVFATLMGSACVVLHRQSSSIATALFSVGLLGALSLLAALATAVVARSGGGWIDGQLAAADLLLFPFLDWSAFAIWLSDRPAMYRAAQQAYVSIGYQPIAILILCCATGRRLHLARFLNAWGISLLICLAPFAWLPARGPYLHYGFPIEQLPTPVVSLPFEFLTVLNGLRDGTIDALGQSAMSGMITVPSFHACSAVLFTYALWPFRFLRWPAAALNLGLILSTPVIGGHFFVDVPAGMLTALIALACGNYVAGRTWTGKPMHRDAIYAVATPG